jgi:hypothetical protein
LRIGGSGMLDLIYLALGLGAFALFGGYALLLRRL